MASHGGKRDGSGRKSKAEELGLPILVDEVIGENGKRSLLKKIYTQAESGSFPHQQLLMNYIYGKPQDKMDVTSAGEKIEAIKHEVIFKDHSKHDKP